MAAALTPETLEALASLDNNHHFAKVRDWLEASAEKSLESTRHAGASGCNEFTFRALGAYHALSDVLKDIEHAPGEYRQDIG